MRGLGPAPVDLEALSAGLELVEVYREEFDIVPWYGFVVGVSDGFVAIHYVSDRFDLDGYRVFRREDLSFVEQEFPLRGLVLRALELKQLVPQAPPELDLESVRSVIESVQACEPLVVLHRELLLPDECEIGRVRIDSEQSYSLLWITTTAEWELDKRVFRYPDVTQVSFAGEYERTLAQVAGPPPEGSR